LRALRDAANGGGHVAGFVYVSRMIAIRARFSLAQLFARKE
jgi:hypothetical protein